jgi:hypothetical protein
MQEFLTPEERARISELQELLIDRFVEHQVALDDGQELYAKWLEREIDGLLHEKERIEASAAAESA